MPTQNPHNQLFCRLMWEEPVCALGDQPMGNRARYARLAFEPGRLLMPSKADCLLFDLLRFNTVRNYTQRKRLNGGLGLG